MAASTDVVHQETGQSLLGDPIVLRGQSPGWEGASEPGSLSPKWPQWQQIACCHMHAGLKWHAP